MRRLYPLLPVGLALLLLVPLAGAQSWPTECLGSVEPAGPPTTFHLPLEVEGGAALDRETPAPFVAALRASPTFRLSGGKFEIGPSFALAYLNPKFDGFGGARAALRLWSASLPEAPIAGAFVAVEGMFGTRGGKQVLGSLRGDVGGVLIVSLFGGRDFNRDETLLGLRLGTDLTWLRKTRRRTGFRPPTPPPPAEQPPVDFYTFVSTVSQENALAAFHVATQPGVPHSPSPLAAEMRSFLALERSRPMPASIAALAERLPSMLLSKFTLDSLGEGIRRAARMAAFEHVSVPAPPDDVRLVGAVVRGWCRATSLVE